MKVVRKLLPLLLITVLTALTLTGCASVKAECLTDGLTPGEVETLISLSVEAPKMTGFAVRLLQTGEQGKNQLYSPYSILHALAMTANGADGETRTQMEQALGLSVGELNDALYVYGNRLPENGEKAKLTLADSLWIRDRVASDVQKEFLQKITDYYRAEIYSAPYDRTTVDDINRWIKKNTDGMIPHLIDDLPANGLMTLVNALAFEAQWQEVYEKDDVRPGTFTRENGQTEDVELMYSAENQYLENDLATGLIKPYAGGYAFAALLPKEGVTVEKLVASLDGQGLHALLVSPQRCDVHAAIPKFDCRVNTKLKEPLIAMGMKDAFDGDRADFSRMFAENDAYIQSVLHEAYISVYEQGTKAGAATAMIVCGSGIPQETKTVTLDRPFVYLLMDTETNFPLFIGALNGIGE